MKRLKEDIWKTIANEKGIALAMVLVLSAISLSAMTGLIYMATVGTQTSGVQKRYKTAYEASLGGVDIMEEIIASTGDPTMITGILGDLPGDIGATEEKEYTTSVNCVPKNTPECTDLDSYDATYTQLETKLNMPTKCWADTADTCDSDIAIDPKKPATYDVRFQIGADPFAYNVYAKLVDATTGNSGVPSEVVKVPGVTSGKGEVVVPHIVYLYTFEVLVENAGNPRERAKTATLYAF